MLIRVLAEPRPGDSRVALVPRSVAALTAAGHRVLLPAGAGAAAGLPDASYAAAGAEIFAGSPPAADLVVAVKESEHRPAMTDLFPDWADQVEYWDIDDLDCAEAAEALPVLEDAVQMLAARLAEEQAGS